MSANAAFLIIVVLVGILIACLLIYARRLGQRKQIVQVFQSKHQVFDNQLSQYNPYYKSLDMTGRDRFLKRVVEFMAHKDFQYIDVQAEEIMPLLISSAAIQLTFGLENFLLDHFNTIYLLKDNYRYGLYNTPFEGHVSEEGIYLSWSNFLREFSDYSDGQNVGLHEMAHALVYVNFTPDGGKDQAFHDRFKDFSVVGRQVFERMQAGSVNETNLLGAYAATSYQEFWAVCVETFFERPIAFKKAIPELYLALCILLNQDPLTPAKVLNLIKID